MSHCELLNLRGQRLPVAERVGVFKRFSYLLEKNIEHLAMILTSEVGKPLQQSRNEVNGGRGEDKMAN